MTSVVSSKRNRGNGDIPSFIRRVLQFVQRPVVASAIIALFAWGITIRYTRTPLEWIAVTVYDVCMFVAFWLILSGDMETKD